MTESIDTFCVTEDSTISSFVYRIDEFCNAVIQVFPDWSVAKVAKDYLNSLFDSSLTREQRRTNAKLLSNKWHNIMSEHYSACSSHKSNIMVNIGNRLGVADLEEKWSSLDPESEDATWKYINAINGIVVSSSVSARVPSSMRDVMNKISVDVARDLQNGEQLNITNMISRVFETVNQEDLQQFASDITNGGTDMSQISCMLAASLGAMESSGEEGVGIGKMIRQFIQ